MKLYRSIKYPSRWFAFGPADGWVMFPAESDGWQKRQPARGIDPLDVREVPFTMGLSAGIPNAQVSADCASALPFAQVA